LPPVDQATAETNSGFYQKKQVRRRTSEKRKGRLPSVSVAFVTPNEPRMKYIMHVNIKEATE